MAAFDYAKSNDGRIHLVSAINGEFTLCGNAFDGDADGQASDPHAWEEVKRGPVTCENCIREIENCRGIRVRHKTPY